MEQNLGIIEFSEVYKNAEFEKVAIFNANMLSEEEAIELVENGIYDSNILIMDKRQYIQIFYDGKEEEIE